MTFPKFYPHVQGAVGVRITLLVMLLFAWGLSSPAQAAWQARLQISIPDSAADSGNASNKLILGVDSSATDNFDNTWDTVAYPGGSLSAYFPHPENSLSKTQLWQDMRADQLPQHWEVEASSQLEGDARLTWDASTVPAQIDLKLVDSQTGNSIDMKTASQYSYAATPSAARKFSIQASEKIPNVGSGPPPPQISGGSGGGGCGMIKDVGRNASYPPPTGAVALNMALLFSPLLWLAFRRIALPRSL